MERENHLTEEELRVIPKIFEGIATEDEITLIKQWLQRSEENRTLYLQMKNIWEASGKRLKPEEIDAELALENVLQTISKKDKRHFGWRTFQRIAAAILLPLVIASYFLGRFATGLQMDDKRLQTYHEVHTAYGTRTHLTLSDGSSVWLNSGSSLTYPDQFGKTRQVTLEGEAYFEVESDVNRPFIVEAGELSIEATGTVFNVLASGFEPQIEVTLVEGSVTVNRKDESDNLVAVVNLQPSQHIVYDTRTLDYLLDSQDPYRYISWKDGLLVFRNVPMAEVVKKIGNLYNVDIELQDEQLKSYRYRATFENESFEEIMKLLKLSSPIDYYEQERSALPDGTFTKRKVIIYAQDKP